MEKEIIIERKKSKSIRISLFMFIITLIMILPIVFYFGDFDFITSDIPLVAVIIAIVILPVLIWTTIYYFKQIFNNKPVLIVNENGIEEGMSTYCTGLIKWEDIDFKKRTLSVNKSAYKETGKPQALKDPKSENGFRTVYFSEAYETALLEWQSEQNEQKKKVGNKMKKKNQN